MSKMRHEGLDVVVQTRRMKSWRPSAWMVPPRNWRCSLLRLLMLKHQCLWLHCKITGFEIWRAVRIIHTEIDTQGWRRKHLLWWTIASKQKQKGNNLKKKRSGSWNVMTATKSAWPATWSARPKCSVWFHWDVAVGSGIVTLMQMWWLQPLNVINALMSGANDKMHAPGNASSHVLEKDLMHSDSSLQKHHPTICDHCGTHGEWKCVKDTWCSDGFEKDCETKFSSRKQSVPGFVCSLLVWNLNEIQKEVTWWLCFLWWRPSVNHPLQFAMQTCDDVMTTIIMSISMFWCELCAKKASCWKQNDWLEMQEKGKLIVGASAQKKEKMSTAVVVSEKVFLVVLRENQKSSTSIARRAHHRNLAKL